MLLLRQMGFGSIVAAQSLSRLFIPILGYFFSFSQKPTSERPPPPGLCTLYLLHGPNELLDRRSLHFRPLGGSTSSKGRTGGQIWMVRLRRGHKYVIVAIGLSRRSAEALAEEINELL